MQNLEFKTVSTKLPVEMIDAFEKTLKRNGQTKSEVIRAFLVEYLRRYKRDKKFKKMLEEFSA